MDDDVTFTWQRTVIGGKEYPFDFSCEVDGETIGRIYRHSGGPEGGHWFWTMNASGPGYDRRNQVCDGTVTKREQAIACVKAAWRAARGLPKR
jgi:hypothetical protein